MPRQQDSLDEFWELMHAALGLQYSAARLELSGQAEAASLLERQAIGLLLEATCLLEPDQPALGTVRQLAVAGLARLHRQKRAGSRSTARLRRSAAPRVPRRKGASLAPSASSAER